MKAFVMLLLLLAHPALAEGPQPFVRGSWQELRQEHAGRPIIVHFWGLTCGPCLVELPRWGEFIREKPGVDVVMVAADPVVGERKAIAGVLAKAGCAAAESWMFADPFTDRLTYEVDPSWAGELPLTLLVGADGEVTTIRGEVNFAELHAWIVQQTSGANQTDGSRFLLLVSPAKSGGPGRRALSGPPPAQARGKLRMPAFEGVIQIRNLALPFPFPRG